MKRYGFYKNSGYGLFWIKADKVKEVIEEDGKSYAILPRGDKKQIVTTKHF